MKTLHGKNVVNNKAVPQGFTLIELILVILIIGVLAVSAASRFDSSGFAEYSYQSRLLSALRAMQQRAMQDTRGGYCFQINFDVTGGAFGPPTLAYKNNTPAEHTATCATSIDYTTADFLRTNIAEVTAEGINMATLDSGNGAFTFIRFDNFGRPTTNVGRCQTRCSISFEGVQTPAICIESEGYIYAC